MLRQSLETAPTPGGQSSSDADTGQWYRGWSEGSGRLGGLDDMIISMYAGAMTVRDIQQHLAPAVATDYGTRQSPKFCAEVLHAVLEWQRRPLESLYPEVYLDALVINVRDGGHC